MIHPADERIVVCVEPSVKKKKHGTMSPHGKCTLEDDVAARNLNTPKEPLHKKAGRMSRPQICLYSRLSQRRQH